jgi:hypothetical protein
MNYDLINYFCLTRSRNSIPAPAKSFGFLRLRLCNTEGTTVLYYCLCSIDNKVKN